VLWRGARLAASLPANRPGPTPLRLNCNSPPRQHQACPPPSGPAGRRHGAAAALRRLSTAKTLSPRVLGALTQANAAPAPPQPLSRAQSRALRFHGASTLAVTTPRRAQTPSPCFSPPCALRPKALSRAVALAPAAQGGRALWWAPTAGPRPSWARGGGHGPGRRLAHGRGHRRPGHAQSPERSRLGQPCCLFTHAAVCVCVCVLVGRRVHAVSGQRVANVAASGADFSPGRFDATPSTASDAMRRSSQAARACQAAATSPGPQAVCSTAVAPQVPVPLPPHRSSSSPRHTWHTPWCASPRSDGDTPRSRGFAAQAAAASAPGGTRTHNRDPFTLVSDELDAVSSRMRAAVVSEVRAAVFQRSGGT
jgi:hypothetical protein